jgi:hypothetical protein
VTTGLRGLSNASKARSTRVLMEKARSMLGELDAKTPIAGQAWASGSLAAPGKVGTEDAGRTGAAVVATRDVIELLRSMPLNRDVLAQVPQEQLMLLSGSDAPVILDGWYNPILFVGAGGLSGVNVDGTSRTIQSPDNRPFFASAGADGDFSSGNDNIYSFQN